ncbi:hypothetical protein AAU61_14350 [Desulfocarbo indianensis]|nr:hypothetical protein AAU61_14350 [Desulfocarbo indianensis]
MKKKGAYNMPDQTTLKAMELLEGMADAWIEKTGIAQKIRSVPVNCKTADQQKRAYDLILRHIKQAYMEGLYVGRVSMKDPLP